LRFDEDADDEDCRAFLDDDTLALTVIQKHERVLIRWSSVLIFLQQRSDLVLKKELGSRRFVE
jgi:hypothetical protein